MSETFSSNRVRYAMIIGVDIESVFGVVSDGPAGSPIRRFESDQLQSIPFLCSISA